MSKMQNSKRYDLENRTLNFAKRVRSYVRKLPKVTGILEDTKQLIRSSGSVGANYIEANECISRKDFVLRIKICRKEAKESHFWLRLLTFEENMELEKARGVLEREAYELACIFGSILSKVQ